MTHDQIAHPEVVLRLRLCPLQLHQTAHRMPLRKSTRILAVGASAGFADSLHGELRAYRVLFSHHAVTDLEIVLRLRRFGWRRDRACEFVISEGKHIAVCVRVDNSHPQSVNSHPIPSRLRRLPSRPLQFGHSLASRPDGPHNLEVLHEEPADATRTERPVDSFRRITHVKRARNCLSVDLANMRARIIRYRAEHLDSFVHHAPPMKIRFATGVFCGVLRYFARPLTCIPCVFKYLSR